MPNIKSAIKRVGIIEKKTLQNNMVKSTYKTAIKAFEADITNNDKSKAETSFRNAIKKIDQACSKGVLKANTASRKKSNLAKKLNEIK